MHSAINDTDKYEPEDWEVGKGKRWLELHN